jgi:nucleoside-diphosphate-sugar epimerase
MGIRAEGESEASQPQPGGLKVLVTGASGFIGSHVVRDLAAQSLRVFPMIRSAACPPALEEFRADVRRASLQDPASLAAAVQGVDAVVHLGGLTRARSESEFMDVNAEGVARLAAAVRAHAPGAVRFVYVSSLSAGGPSTGAAPVREDDPPRPVSAYGRSKLHGEVRLRESAGPLPWTILRPPIVYGPGERDLHTMFRYAERGWVPLVAARDRAYSIVHVRDLAAAILAVLRTPAAAGQVYYVAEDRAYLGRELVAHIGKALGRTPRIVPVPRWAAALVAAAGSGMKAFLSRPPLVTLDKLPEILQSWVCSGAKLERDCGFRCRIAFPEGAAETAAWYRSERWL